MCKNSKKNICYFNYIKLFFIQIHITHLEQHIANTNFLFVIYSMYMSYESFEEYQYDSCVSHGLCSINPRTSALQTVLVLYLRQFAKYALNLDIDNDTRDFILNTIAITIYNSEFNETSFNFAVEKFREILPKIMGEYFEKNPDDNMKLEQDKALELFRETYNIIPAIQYGEKIFNRAIENLETNIRDLYNIALVILKSMSINLLDLESFDKKHNDSFSVILKILSLINIENIDLENLKKEIFHASKTDITLMKLLREAQEERYGKQCEREVSYSTTPGKAVLVVGSNIRELETILESLQNHKIDVYTHDEMILAHTFPKFSTYPHLKGQYGQGIESCLLDFATFPGPIILTKYSLHNIENFYRGRLFTTDYTLNPKGIIKIENNDFSQVIETAEKTKGFKRGKQCETVTIGFNFEETISKIKEKIETKNYKKIFIIGLDGYSLEQKTYFEKLIKLAPKSVLIISGSYNIEQENLIHINTCYDSYSFIRIYESISKVDLPITFFVPKCEKGSVSQMVYLSEQNNVSVYVGKCTPIILNPSLMNTMQDIFAIKSITNSKKDLEQILEDK